MLPQAAVSFQRSERLLAATLALIARRSWSQMGDDFDATWPAIRQRLTLVTTAAQLNAARLAEPYLAEVLAETGQPNAPVAALQARQWAGIAADGRSLPGFLDGAVVAAKQARTELSTPDALAVGGRWVEMASETLVADTARSAVITAITVRPDIEGYVRSTGGNACSRCTVLAGKFYRYSTAFHRHPRCHCMMTPASRGMSYQLREDLPDVRGGDLSSLDVANRAQPGARAMPERIIGAAPNREAAIDALRQSGFVSMSRQVPTRGVAPHTAISSMPKATTPVGKAARDSLDEIAKVHRVPEGMAQVPVKASTAEGYQGVYEYSTLKETPTVIRVSSITDHPTGTFTHEFGHFLDHQANLVDQFAEARTMTGSELRARFGTSPMGKKDPRMAAFTDAVNASPSKRALVEGAAHAGPGQNWAYYNSSSEEWARAYHQWIATRSGSSVMQAEIAAIRARGGAMGFSQWADDEFVPIAEALDNIFRSAGLLA